MVNECLKSRCEPKTYSTSISESNSRLKRSCIAKDPISVTFLPKPL